MNVTERENAVRTELLVLMEKAGFQATAGAVPLDIQGTAVELVLAVRVDFQGVRGSADTVVRTPAPRVSRDSRDSVDRVVVPAGSVGSLGSQDFQVPAEYPDTVRRLPEVLDSADSQERGIAVEAGTQGFLGFQEKAQADFPGILALTPEQAGLAGSVARAVFRRSLATAGFLVVQELTEFQGSAGKADSAGSRHPRGYPDSLGNRVTADIPPRAH